MLESIVLLLFAFSCAENTQERASTKYVPRYPPHCETMTEKGVCTSCQYPYGIANGTCYPLIPNCVTLKHGGTCEECRCGYYPHQSGCVRLPPYCTNVDDKGACTQCLPHFNMVNGSCKVPISNCMGMGSSTTCLQCALGYFPNAAYPNATKCFKYNDKFANCAFAASPTACGVCNAGWMLQDSGCVPSVDHCRVSDKAAIGYVCSVCDENYTFSSATGVCQETSSLDPNSNCITSFSVPIVQILPGFALFVSYPTQPQCRINILTVNVTISGVLYLLGIYGPTNQLSGTTNSLVFYTPRVIEAPADVTIDPVINGSAPVTVPSSSIHVISSVPTIIPPVNPPVEKGVELSGGDIAGIVIAVVVVAVAIVVGIYFIVKCSRRYNMASEAVPTMSRAPIMASTSHSEYPKSRGEYPMSHGEYPRSRY